MSAEGTKGMGDKTHIKRSSLAGRWYEGSPSRLRQQVDDLLSAAVAPLGREALGGLVVPHAAYPYSGAVAAAGYATLRDVVYSRAVILAPSHFAAFRGAAVLDVDCFESPLGLIAVDRTGVMALSHEPLFQNDAEPYRDEHALEIQLPFLQRVLPDLQVVPVLLGSLSDDDYALIAHGLRSVADADTLFIVSSDFVHYGWRFGYQPFPPDGVEPVRTGLRNLDMGAIAHICSGDAGGFREYVARTGATICGRVPIGAFLTLHQRRTAGQLLAYRTSLDVTGDFEHSVSYASIAFPRSH